MSKRILHVDMDAFYASIEQLDNPEYRGKPVVVGALPDEGNARGVVSAASYEARKFGVHSAMPISRAYKACPKAIFVIPRMARYAEISEEIMKVFERYSPLVEQISIDEAFLDCSGTDHLFGDDESLGKKIKADVKSTTGLTASIGIAGNKSVAKIASDLEKPDGLTICPRGKEKEFLADLNLSRLWGAGKKTIEKLNEKGYFFIRDIQNSSLEVLQRSLGKHGVKLYELANGIDRRAVSNYRERKSISEERTYLEDTGDIKELEKTLFRISERLSHSMRVKGLRGKTITLKIRFSDFETFTRSQTLSNYFNDTNTMRQYAWQAFKTFNSQKKVRLIGISMSNLDNQIAEPEQLELFSNEQANETDRVLDELKAKFGSGITRASFLKTKGDPHDDELPRTDYDLDKK